MRMEAKAAFWLDGPWKGRLAIVARPRGGEWLDDETRAWREAGIDIVVSLLEPDEEAELALAGESASAAAGGLEFRSFPIPDRGVPSSREAVAKLVDQIIDACTRARASRSTAARALADRPSSRPPLSSQAVRMRRLRSRLFGNHEDSRYPRHAHSSSGSWTFLLGLPAGVLPNPGLELTALSAAPEMRIRSTRCEEMAQ